MDTITIKTGESQTYDGVTYTATSDAVLNLDDEGSVSGIVSGSVVAQLSDTESSPQVTFDGSTAFDFSCSDSDSALQVKASGTSINYTGGQVTYSANGISAAGEVSVTGYVANLLPFDVKFDIPDAGLNLTFDTANKITTFSADETAKFTLTFPESSSELLGSLKGMLTTLLGDDVSEYTANKLSAVVEKLISSPTTAQIQGVHSWNQNDKKLTINQDSFLALNVLDYALSMTAEGGNVDGLSFFSKLTGDDVAIGARFTPSTDENAGLNVSLAKSGSKIYEGVLNVTAGAIDIDVINVKASVEKDTAVTMSLQDGSLAEMKFDNAASVTYSADESGLAYLTFGENDGKLLMTTYRDDKPVFYVEMEINGSITLDTDNQNVGVTKDTITTITSGDYKATINVSDDAGFKIGLSNDAITITPQEGDGSLNVSLAKGDDIVFSNVVSVSNGSVIFNPATQEMTLTDGTEISFVINDNYTLTATASGDATSTLSLSTSGVTLTPSTDEDDGTLNLTLTGTSSGSLSANIKVLSGSFTLGGTGALTVAKGTELQITFSDDYIVNFKAIDDAGGTLSLGTDGITFAPGDGDGGLQLSITRDGQTRSASLDVTGSVTYKLDGSISLTQGTVVKNVFDDGNILTITANTTASGSINFNPQTGLTITPATADALTVSLTTGDLEVVKISSIDGSINYSGGIITASDGTTTEIENGTYSDIYATETSGDIELISEGSTFRSNDDEEVFTLEKAGNYNLNGMDITTSKDNVEVRLPDYNTVTFAADAGITYNGQEFSGDAIVSIINGNVTIGQIISNTGDNTLISGGDGFDSISNTGDNVIVNALGGNDTIISDHAYYSSIDGGDGSDSIIISRGHYSYIDGGAGNDYILGDDSSDWAMGGYATINGGDGDDYIDTGSSDSASINGGAGDDIIITSGNDATLNGGAGDDIISLHGASVDNNIIEYETDSGNDIIYGLNSTGTISIGSGAEYSTVQSGDDVIVTVGENTITVAGASSVNVINYELAGSEIANTVNNTLVGGTILDDSISNRGSNVTIDAQAGKDIVLNFGANTSINGGAGDDSIYNEGADGSTIEGDYGDDLLWNNSANVLINGSYGNDAINNSGANDTLDGGAGANLISLTDEANSNTIVLSGNTTVEGFKTGFGEGSDTIYIAGDPAGVELKADGLYFANSTDSLTLSDITNTAKVNIFHESRNVLNKGVFIAGNDWYSVESGDLSVNSGEEVYFVGTSTIPSGVDFSGISSALNVTMDTAYEDSEDFVPGTTTWINSVYSLRGGAGDTTITGSDLSDTIIAGTGNTTINATAGDDFISLNSSAALVEYASGDGNDVIEGFNTNSTLSINGTYSTTTSGDDVVVNVGEESITLANAAILETVNIVAGSAEGDLETATSLVGAMLYRTEEGYPVIAGLAFHPTEYHGDEPTNYADKENWTIESADGLELSGVHYTPENSNDKWVVIIHGYGHNHKHMYPFAGFYLENGYNVLMVDQRAAGDSEGDWLTMGTAESADIALWTQEIARRNSDAKITLFGVSMGAATAMLAAARSDITNVTSLVEDCGYSNVVDIINLFNNIIFNEDQATIDLMQPVSESLTGYNLKDAAPINSISSVKVPTMFITGSDDSVVGTYMLSDLYDASGAEVKEKFIVEGAGHGVAGLIDPVGYSNAVFRFVAEADEEGWETANVTDDISLRGTKYNDTIANSGDNVTINTGAGDDIISLDSSAALIEYASGDGNDTISGFSENSTLQIGDGTGVYSTTTSGNDVIVTVGDGKITLAGGVTLETVNIIGDTYLERVKQATGADSIQTVTGNTYKVDNNNGNNLVYVDETARGSKGITLGNGGDAVLVEASRGANVTVTGGAGNDTLYDSGTASVTFDMSKGADKISSRFNGENITLKGYKASNGGGIATGNDDTQEIVSEIVNDGNMTFGDGEIKLTGDNGILSKFTFAENTNAKSSVIFNMFDKNGEAQAIGFTNSDGGKLDVSKESKDYLLVGNYNDNKGVSTLIGGKGNDTLLGGEGDVLNAGAGNENLILLQNDDKRGGANIILNSGKTTVQNFKAGFDDDSDRVFGGVNDTVDFKFDGTNVSVKTNDAWHGVLSDIGDGADFANILTADVNGPVKVAVAQENAVITVEDELADFYVGKNSGVDFTAYDGELMANLGSQETSLGTGEILFSGINQLTAGSGQTTLMGSDKNETLYAGTGTASLYGGGGKNYLANTSAEKDGATTFFVLGTADGAKNTISGFEFVTADGIADKIEIDTTNNKVSDVRANGNDVVIEVSNRTTGATERAVIEGAIGQNMQFSDNVIAQVNTTALNYDGTANYFVATENNAAINVNSDVVSPVSIWLDVPAWAGSKTNTFVGDIRTIDASGSSIKAELAGNDANNTILAGSGNTSLWGGNGGDDLLIGGAGRDNFYYTYGNGDDTISGTTSGDTVFLSQVRLDQISGATVENNVATLNFTDGGRLTVQNADKANYVVTQGEEMRTYRVENGGFVQN